CSFAYMRSERRHAPATVKRKREPAQLAFPHKETLVSQTYPEHPLCLIRNYFLERIDVARDRSRVQGVAPIMRDFRGDSKRGFVKSLSILYAPARRQNVCSSRSAS